jgi:hypothetical protein
LKAFCVFFGFFLFCARDALVRLTSDPIENAFHAATSELKTFLSGLNGVFTVGFFLCSARGVVQVLSCFSLLRVNSLFFHNMG